MSTHVVQGRAPELLKCISCGCPVELHDVATHEVARNVFQCEPCREGPVGQTSLDVGQVLRVERRTSYDPRDARIPF